MAKDFEFGFTIKAFTEGFDKINKDLDAFNKKTKDLSKGFTALGTKLTLGLTAPISIFAATSIKAFKEQEKNLTKFADSFGKQGKRIGLGFEELTQDANEFSKNSLFESDDILGGVTTQLLSFSTINKDVFKQAQAVIIDFASETGDSLESATLLIGKALQNPTEGLALLRRQTGLVTDAQLALITNLDKTGRSAEAQAAILKILSDRYGGFAEKIANTDSGKLDQLIKSFKELQQNFGEAFLKVFRPVIEFLTDFIRLIDKLTPQSKVIIAVFASIVAAVGPLLIVLGQLTAAVTTLGIRLAIVAGPAGLLVAIPILLIAASEAFDGLGNAMNFFMVEINQQFLNFFDLISRIQDVFSFLPGMALAQAATGEIKSFLQSNITFLNGEIDAFIAKTHAKLNETKPPPVILPPGDTLTQAEIDAALKRKQAMDKAIKEMQDKVDKENELRAKLEIDRIKELDKVAEEFTRSQEERNKQLAEMAQIGANSFSQFFEDIAFGAKSAEEAIKNLGKTLVQSLFSNAIQSAFSAGFAALFVPGKAKGGLIGGMAEGGPINGPGTGTSDSVLARVSRGEFVVKADSVKSLGLDFMNMINNFGSHLNSFPKFATGGPVNSQKPSVSVNVLNNSSQPVTAKSSQSVDVRGTVINIILEDLKTNGPISQGNQQAFGLRR